MMKIYNYNKETKEFTTSTNATENPLEKGKYLIPANATTKEPLASKDGFAVCFNETKKEWEYQEDNRGKTIYSTIDKTESQVDYLGAIKDGFTSKVPQRFDKWLNGEWVEESYLKEQALQLEAKKARADKMLEGDMYTLNDVEYQISFTKEDGDGLVQVKSAFELGLTQTIIHFSNGTELPINPSEFAEFASWFVNKRNEFF